MMMKTDDVPFVSSLHGRQRRSQRDITKRDLQSAIKYGVKARGRPCPKTGEGRWMYTFQDIVYITNETSEIEITSWALELPLDQVIIPERTQFKRDEARRRILANPSIITSHTVLIVDMSGSMNKSDMNGHRTRSRGVYYFLAEKFTANRLDDVIHGKLGGPSASFTDVVSLVEMRSTATVVFEYEPFSWILFNKFVQLAEQKDARDHGNYFEAFRTAFTILDRHKYYEKCALCLFFFSDGRPSDLYMEKGRLFLRPGETSAFPNNLLGMFLTKCDIYGKRLTFSAFGFGKDANEFAIMQTLVSYAESTGAKTTFGHSYLDVSSLGTILDTTLTSLTETRTLLSRLNINDLDTNREKRNVQKKDFQETAPTFDRINWTIFNTTHWNWSTESVTMSSVVVRRMELEWAPRPNSTAFEVRWRQVPFLHSAAVGIAVNKCYFGEGAERIVYKLTEIDSRGKPIGEPLVAKESLYKHKKQDLEHLRKWHKTFVKTQLKAEKLAKKFNNKLDGMEVSNVVPRIHFLSCFVYECSMEGQEYAYLAEKQLDPKRYLKWNNNAGGVDGIAQRNLALPVEAANTRGVEVPVLIPALPQNLEAVAEEEEDDDDDSDNDENLAGAVATPGLLSTVSQRILDLEGQVLESDVLQAFSHWTHRVTSRELLVCDLQGELNLSGAVPVFELTDPCIHSDKSHRPLYGRTDHGRRGMKDFFWTHQCNSVCQILGLDVMPPPVAAHPRGFKK